MSLLTREKLWNELKAKRLAPLYLLFGEEDFLRNAAANRIAEEILGLSLADMLGRTTGELWSRPGPYAEWPDPEQRLPWNGPPGRA